MIKKQIINPIKAAQSFTYPSDFPYIIVYYKISE